MAARFDRFLKDVIKGSNTWLGLDIGSHSIKIVQVSRSGQLIRVDQMLSIPTPAEAVAEGRLVSPELISTILREAAAEYGLYTKQVVGVLPEKNIITRQVKMPLMPEEEIAAALQWEVEKYIPVPGEDLVLDFLYLGIVDGQQGKETDVLLIAAPKKMVYPYCDLMLAGGFHPQAIDTLPFALWRLLGRQAGGAKAGSPFFSCLDIGAGSTNVITFLGETPIFSRNIPIGGNLLTQSIARVMGIDAAEAEQLKIEQADLSTKSDCAENDLRVQLDQAIRPVLTDLTREVRRSLEYCKMKWTDHAVERLYLTGGTAMLPGLTDFLSDQLEVPVEICDPIKCLDGNTESKNLKHYRFKAGPVFAVALGLALREVVD